MSLRDAISGFKLALFGVIAIVLCGCSGSGSSGSTASTQTTISGYPTTAVTVAPYATAVLTAYVNNDQNGDGVTWSISGPGSLSNATNSAPAVNTVNTVTYTAGAPTSATTATVTATSVANKSLSVTFTINLEAALVITTTSPLPNATLNTSYSATLAATGGLAPITYTVASGSLPAGLSLSSAGVLSGSPSVIGSFNFTAQAADSSGLTATKSFSLVVIGPLTITSGNSASGEIGLPFRFAETATGGVSPYAWSVTQGTLPAGLTLSSSTGTVSGSPTGSAGNATLTFTVADSTGKTASHVVTIDINAARSSANNAELNGAYAFLLGGFDASGNPLAAVGSFTANGAGVISSGSIDLNGTALTAAQTNVPLTAGSYGIGAGNRGVLTLTTAAASYTFTVALGSFSNGLASAGFLDEFDTSGQQLTGSLALRNTASYSVTAITGGYAFGVTGFAGNATSHAGAVGELQLSTGAVATGEIIESTRGGAGPLDITSGSYAISTSGRATITLSLGSGAGSIDLIGYPVSATTIYLLSADSATSSAPLLFGTAAQQSILSGNFSNATLNGTAVEAMSRTLTTSSGSGNASEVNLGLYAFDGSGHVTLASDTNDAGTATTSSATGEYSVAANGLTKIITATGTGGCENCQTPEVIGYLFGANQGFALDLLSGIGTGQFIPQTQTSFSTASLNGTYATGSIAPSIPAMFLSGELTAGSSSSLAAALDENTSAALVPDVAVTYTETVATNGRTLLQGSDGSKAVLYLISPSAGILLSLSNPTPVAQAVQQ